MVLELWDRPSNELALWAFFSDADGSFEVTRYRAHVPPEVEAWFQAEARWRLPKSQTPNQAPQQTAGARRLSGGYGSHSAPAAAELGRSATERPAAVDRLPGFKRRMQWFIDNRPVCRLETSAVADGAQARWLTRQTAGEQGRAGLRDQLPNFRTPNVVEREEPEPGGRGFESLVSRRFRTTKWSRHSLRIDPMTLSTRGFCQGARGAISTSRIPIRSIRRANSAP